jgi:YopJ Serine/Threonine acetyltransferase/Leucine rich repeat
VWLTGRRTQFRLNGVIHIFRENIMGNMGIQKSTADSSIKIKSESDPAKVEAKVEKKVDSQTRHELQQQLPALSKSPSPAGFSGRARPQSPAPKRTPVAAPKVFELTETDDSLILTVDPASLKAGIQLPSGWDAITKLVCHGLDVMPKKLPVCCEEIDFSNSPGLVIPDNLVGYEEITSLNLSGCQFSEFPNIFSMKELKKVNLDFNDIKTIPEKISALKKLENFSIQSNQLESLPSAFEGFAHLEVLVVKNNAIFNVPYRLNWVEPPRIQSAGDQQRETRLLMEKKFHLLSDEELNQALRHLNQATHTLKQEWLGPEAPAKHPRWCKVKDIVFMGALVQAENILTPGLNAQRTASVLEAARDILKLARTGKETHQTVNMQLVAELERLRSISSEDDFTHSIAIDVRVIYDESHQKISLVALETTKREYLVNSFLQDTHDTLSKLGVNITYTVKYLDIQKTNAGCNIFSLSTAKKMHAHRSVLNNLHDQALNGDTEATTQLPLAFYKHSTSNSTINALQQAGQHVDSAPVNQAQQSLRQRAQLGRRTRAHPQFPQGLTYNSGIEAKRIQFFARACFVLQKEARRRGLPLDPEIHLYDSVPTSSVLPLLEALTPEAQPDPLNQGGQSC